MALLPSTWSPVAQAGESFVTTAVHTEDADSTDTGVRTVRYSTGKAGHQLKWLACRPSKTDAPPQEPARQTSARLAQYTAPVAAGPVDPFDDPFEDHKRVAQGSAPRTILHDDALEGSGPQPLVTGSLPQITIDDTAPDSQPPDQSTSELEESLAMQPRAPEKECSKVKLKRITEITTDISATGDMFPAECTFEDIPEEERMPPKRQQEGWAPVTFTWKASALCSKPLYFEDVHLERYGHSFGPYLQPLVSGAHFFLTVPVLPYKMGLYPPNECVYSLGYYRPGSCAPYMLDPLPLSIRAGLLQAGAWTGAALLVP